MKFVDAVDDDDDSPGQDTRIGYGQTPESVSIEFFKLARNKFLSVQEARDENKFLKGVVSGNNNNSRSKRAARAAATTTTAIKTNARHHRSYFRATATCAVNVLSLSGSL